MSPHRLQCNGGLCFTVSVVRVWLMSQEFLELLCVFQNAPICTGFNTCVSQEVRGTKVNWSIYLSWTWHTMHTMAYHDLMADLPSGLSMQPGHLLICSLQGFQRLQSLSQPTLLALTLTLTQCLAINPLLTAQTLLVRMFISLSPHLSFSSLMPVVMVASRASLSCFSTHSWKMRAGSCSAVPDVPYTSLNKWKIGIFSMNVYTFCIWFEYHSRQSKSKWGTICTFLHPICVEIKYSI